MSRVAVILPAAGSSTRFGLGEKKPFVSLAGIAIWARTAQIFRARADVGGIYLVVSPGDCDGVRERFAELLAELDVAIVAGGSERFESVANALDLIPATIERVAIHDAVRPLTAPEAIEAVFAAAEATGAALLALPNADTLKRVDAQMRVEATIDRADIWRAQTPQVFRRDWLVEAYANRSRQTEPITDDAQLVEALGYPVMAVPGSAINFKITTRDDLALAEAIWKTR